MGWKPPKIWESGECWIMGGGPSMPRQFGVPDDVVTKIMKKGLSPSYYSPYLSQLHDKNVIGINMSYLVGSWIKVVFFGDKGFFTRNKAGLAKFPNLKVTCVGAEKHYEYRRAKIKVMDRDVKREGVSNRSGRVCWNYNSGAASISLAVQLGVKKIYLLGFDMGPDKEGITHWHSEYKQRIRDNTFARHLRGFGQIAKDADRLGVEILNVSPKSAISSLKKVELKDVL